MQASVIHSVAEFLCKVRTVLSVSLSSTLLVLFNRFSQEEDMSDNELVERAREDPDYFTQLFDRYFQRVYQFHFTRLRVKQDAEDLTSDTFMKIYTKLDRYTDQGVPFAAWLFTIARNTLIDHVRKQKLKPVLFDEPPKSDQLQVEFDMNKINTKVLRKHLWAAIETLPEKQQQLWALKLTSDLPHKEIALILETSVNNVDVMVSRSLSVLKKRLTYLVS
jgi:RNA polymerase sigma-70 factor (ECF subfamily)